MNASNVFRLAIVGKRKPLPRRSVSGSIHSACSLAIAIATCLLMGGVPAGAQRPLYGTAPIDPNWGDPYQMVTPASPNAFVPITTGFNGTGFNNTGFTPNNPPTQVMPAAAVTTAGGGLLGNGQLFNGRLFNGGLLAGPGFAGRPLGSTQTQLNPPVLASPVQGGLLSGGPFSGGLLGRSLSNANPLFPRFQNRVDSRLYLRGEYLLWDVSGMDSPALVTTSPSGTDRTNAGVLGEAGTSVLFGGNEINEGTTGGFLFSGGFWLNPQRSIALEAEYFRLNEQDDRYNGSSNGQVILARPFFDILGGQETAQLLSFPDLVHGGTNIDTSSKFRSFLINGRIAVCPTHGACCQQCGMRDRTDFIIGYRNLRLRDSISINESITSQLTNAPGSISASDQFQTTNQFHGLQLGFVHRAILNRAWLESSMRVAIGNNEQTLRVNGSTTFNEAGVVDTLPGGIFAQRSNIGTHNRDEFTMVPELGLRLGMRVTDRLHATIGYTVLYLPSVVRASDQIDTDLNTNLFPEEVVPFSGPLRPRLLWRETDYIAHGLSFGGELHF